MAGVAALQGATGPDPAAPAEARPRLAVFVPSMRQGGAERSMLKLAGGLAGRGHPVDLVLAQAEGPYLAEVPEGVKVVDLGAGRVLGALPALRRYLRSARPHALLAVMRHANLVALWARRLAGVPTRIVLSERIALSPDFARRRSLKGRLVRGAMGRFYPWADGIVAVCHALADDLAQTTGVARDSIDVVYNPIVTPELERRVRMPADHPWLRDPGAPPLLVAAGRLRPQKGFATLIRAFARARRERPARLLVLGDGPERPALEALVAELGLGGDVELPGFVANPYPSMARAEAFVLSSEWEGLPGVLIEALYCGTRLIATDCPTGPREILRGGEYGALVPVRDEVALAEAMARALAGKLPRPPREAWQRFELEHVLDQYLEVLLGGDGVA